MAGETTELTDEAINTFLSEKCGRGHLEEPVCIVPFTDSLDALFAPGGPVEKCREAEYAVSLYLGSFTRPPWTYEALIEIDMPSRGDDGTFEMAVSPNPARALAEACALALGIMGCAQGIT